MEIHTKKYWRLIIGFQQYAKDITIAAWTFKIDGSHYHENLPIGWVRCDGQKILEPSMWAGGNTPNLNGGKKFLISCDKSELWDDASTLCSAYLKSAF